MKAARIFNALAAVLFVIGMILIIGAFGTDDFYLKELHQAHQLNYSLIIYGFILCLPEMIHLWWCHGC